MKDDVYSDFRMASRSVSNAGVELSAIAKAFRVTGNAKLAEKLEDIATDLYFASQQIDTAVHNHVHGYFQDSVDQIGKTIDAIMTRKD
jgi:hypothetical protein